MQTLFDFLIKNLKALWPIRRVDEWRVAIIVRAGRIRSQPPTGLHWVWPFYEEMITWARTECVVDLPTGTVTTADGDVIVISANLAYVMRDMTKSYRSIWNAEKTIVLLAIGHITSHVARKPTREVVRERAGIEVDLLRSLNDVVKPMGIEITRLMLTDCAITRAHSHFVDGTVPNT